MSSPVLPASVLDLRRVVPEVMGLNPWLGGRWPEHPGWWADDAPIVPLTVEAGRLCARVAMWRRLGHEGEAPTFVLLPEFAVLYPGCAWFWRDRPLFTLPSFRIPNPNGDPLAALYAAAMAVEEATR